MDEELLRPTIDAAPVTGSSPPWRPDSIAYPAFFGGALAATVLGLINGRRLGVKLGPLLAIAATGIAAVVGRVLVTNAINAGGSTRVLGSAAGLAVWGVIMTVQKRPFRAFLYWGRDPASLVGPGWAAMIGCGLVETLVVLAVL
jgi:hypothetical protein